MRHLASPSGIARGELGRRLRWEGQGRVRRQIPPALLATNRQRINEGTYQSWVANKFACQPEERLLEVVVGLGRDVVVLEVLLSVEGNGLGLDLSLLDINLVSGQNDGNVLADTDQITCFRVLAVAAPRGLTGWTYGASWERSCR